MPSRSPIARSSLLEKALDKVTLSRGRLRMQWASSITLCWFHTRSERGKIEVVGWSAAFWVPTRHMRSPSFKPGPFEARRANSPRFTLIRYRLSAAEGKECGAGGPKQVKKNDKAEAKRPATALGPTAPLAAAALGPPALGSARARAGAYRRPRGSSSRRLCRVSRVQLAGGSGEGRLAIGEWRRRGSVHAWRVGSGQGGLTA